MNYMQNVFSMYIEALETSMAFLKIQWFSFLAPKRTLRKKEKQYGFSLNMNCIWVYILFDEVQSRGKLRMFWWNSHLKIFHFNKHVYATVLLKIIQANFIEVYVYLYDALYKQTHVDILKALSSGSQPVSPDPFSKPLYPKFTYIMSQSGSKVIIMEQQQK